LEEYRNDVDIMCIGVRFRFFHSKRKKRKKKKKKKEGGGFYDLTYKTLTTFFSVIWICPVMMGYKLSTFGSCFDNKFCLSLVVDLRQQKLAPYSSWP